MLRSYVTLVSLLLILLVTSADAKHNGIGGALALRDLSISPLGYLTVAIVTAITNYLEYRVMQQIPVLHTVVFFFATEPRILSYVTSDTMLWHVWCGRGIFGVSVLPRMRISAHTRMGVPYEYTRMGRYTHMGQNISVN